MVDRATKMPIRKSLEEMGPRRSNCHPGMNSLTPNMSCLRTPAPGRHSFPAWTQPRCSGRSGRGISVRSTARRVTDRNGNIGPTVWIDGRVAGGWVQDVVGEMRFSVHLPTPNQKDLLARRGP